MHPSTCLTLSMLQGSNANAVFPQLAATGGAIVGIPVFVTASAQRSGSPPEKLVVAVDGAKVVYADDGGGNVAASNVATLQADDARGARAWRVQGIPTKKNASRRQRAGSAPAALIHPPGRSGRENEKPRRGGARYLILPLPVAGISLTLIFFGFFSGFCDPAFAYAGATAKVRIAGATYAAFLMKSRRPALALDVPSLSMGVITLRMQESDSLLTSCMDLTAIPNGEFVNFVEEAWTN